MARRLGLGRGLSALIPDRSADRPEQPTPDDADGPAGAVPHTGQSSDRSTGEVALDRIHPNPRQPRSEFSAPELEQLATTIRTHGVIQPLLVAAQPDGDYQLIAGERRWRAARLAGLTSVPITVREVSDQELLELAIVENVQRQDLNPLEEADAYRRLIEDFHLTQRQVGERVGRSRATIANTLRLLELPEDLRASLAAREITEGHARALLGASTPEGMHKAWRQLLGRRLNVRDTEKLVRELRDAPARREGDPASIPPAEQTEHGASERGAAAITGSIAEALQRALSTRVVLRRDASGSGTMTVYFYSDEELDGILALLLTGESL